MDLPDLRDCQEMMDHPVDPVRMVTIIMSRSMQLHVNRAMSPVNDARLVRPVSKVPMVCRVCKDRPVHLDRLVDLEISVSQDLRDQVVTQDNPDFQDRRVNPVYQAVMAPVVVAFPVHAVVPALLATRAVMVRRVHEATTVNQVQLVPQALQDNQADMVNLVPMDRLVVPAFPATMQPIARAHRDRPYSFRDSRNTRWLYQSITTIRPQLFFVPLQLIFSTTLNLVFKK